MTPTENEMKLKRKEDRLSTPINLALLSSSFKFQLFYTKVTLIDNEVKLKRKETFVLYFTFSTKYKNLQKLIYYTVILRYQPSSFKFQLFYTMCTN